MPTRGTSYARTEWFLVPGPYTGEPGNQFQRVPWNQREPLGTTGISKKKKPQRIVRPPRTAWFWFQRVPWNQREPVGTALFAWETFQNGIDGPRGQGTVELGFGVHQPLRPPEL
jgi:hypothetical protein